jgi:hypothetical protein
MYNHKKTIMLKNEYQKLIESNFNSMENQDSIVVDGPLDIDKWINNDMKLLFYYKETYGYNEYGGISISDHYKKWIYDNNKTYKKIGVLSYLLFETLKTGKILSFNEKELKEIYRNHDFLIDIVSNISMVNIAKISIPENETNDSLIRDTSRLNRILLKEQLKILNPDMIICGGRVTADSLYADLDYLSSTNYSYGVPEIIDNKIIAPICHLSAPNCWYFDIYSYYLLILELLKKTHHNFS